MAAACGSSGAAVEIVDAGVSDAFSDGPDASGETSDAAPPRATSPLWDSTEVLELRVVGPMQPAFAAAHAGEPDGIYPPVRLKEPFDGTLTYNLGDGPVVLDVHLRVRGNSSLQECAFPKLRATAYVDEQRLASIFYKAKRSKIGTHCADLPDDDHGTIGRLRNEKAAHREAYVYHAIRLLAVPGQWVRPARITYVDTSTDLAQGGWTVERDALVLDHASNVAKRHGAVLRDDASPWTSAGIARLERRTAAVLYVTEALFGNWDWSLEVDEGSATVSSPWNVAVMTMSDGTEVPWPHDFDLASAVTGTLLDARDFPEDLYPEESLLFRQTAYYLHMADAVFSEELRAEVVALFRAREGLLRTALADFAMDAAGRANMVAHLDVFYAVLEREYPLL